MDLLHLPHEILLHVGSYLTCAEIHSLSLSCNTFRRDIGYEDVIWRNLYMYDFGGLLESEVTNNTWKEKYHKSHLARADEIIVFNTNPTVIPRMAELQNLKNFNSESFTLRFLQEKNISRVARGVYLSLSHARMSGLLGNYFDTLDFSNKTVLESLSLLLKFIQFPSHFSVITKFMLYFADRYFACNSADTIFKNSDAVYVLGFGIIMLNTDMHNAAVKNKMTLAQYIHNSNGINDGENLPERVLADIYSKVQEKPLVFNKSTTANPYDSSLWSWVSDWITKLRC